jgi:hypothetical protein
MALDRLLRAWRRNVNWPILRIAGVALLLLPCAVMAQWGAGRGAGGRGTSTGRSGVPGDDPTIATISKEIAAGATQEQRGQFQSAAQSAEAAIKLAEEWQAGFAKAAEPPGYASRLAALQTALDKAKQANHDFLQSFSQTQTAEFKDLVKKVNKAGGEVDAKWKALKQEVERGAGNDQQKLSGKGGQLAQAVTNFRRQQQVLGTKMGIEN